MSAVRAPLGALAAEAEVRGLFAGPQGRALSYALHGDLQVARHGWLICNPLFEEKAFSQRVLFNYARRLAAVGFCVMRFDYAGQGDSDGEDLDAGVDDWIADIEAAAAFMRARSAVTTLGLVGLRAGALLAARAAPAVGGAALQCWEPVLDGAAYFQDCLRANLTAQLATHKRIVETRDQLMDRLARGGRVNLLGHEVGARAAHTVAALRLPELLAVAGCDADLIHVGRTPQAMVPAAWSGCGELARVELHVATGTAFWGETRWHDDVQRPLAQLGVQLAQLRLPSAPEGRAA